MRYNWLILSVLVLISFAFEACKDNEITEVKEDTTVAEYVLVEALPFFSFTELVLDYMYQDTFGKMDEHIFLPSNPNEMLLESNSTNRYWNIWLSLGDVGQHTPKGQLCKDGIYRGGLVRLIISKSKSTNLIQGSIEFNKDFPTWIGDGVEMWEIYNGKLTIAQIGKDRYSAQIVNVDAKKGGQHISMAGNYTLEVRPIEQRSLLNTIIYYQGAWEIYNSQRQRISIQTTENLKRNMIGSCYSVFSGGGIEINSALNLEPLKVVFNPKTVKECENLAKITLFQKETYFRY